MDINDNGGRCRVGFQNPLYQVTATGAGSASAFSMLGLSGCNTTAGMGENVEAAGDAIEDKAQETEPY